MTHKTDDYITYEMIIRKVKEKIKYHQGRISDEACQYPILSYDLANNLFTLPHFPCNDNSEELEMLKTDLEVLKAEYIEEYKAISEALGELGFGPEQIWDGDSQYDNKEIRDKFMKQLKENLSFSNQALKVWEKICVPIRFRANNAYLISNSRELGIEPRILVSDINRLAINSIYIISEDKEEIKNLRKKEEKWQIATFILGIIFIITVMIIF